MITREQVRDEILQVESPHILAELPTSFGKTRVAIDLMLKHIHGMVDAPKILIVIPRLVLIDNWKDEFKKWGCEDYLEFVTFVTYVSFPKMAGDWDVVIFDEVHHLSERCRESLMYFDIYHSISLSATVSRDMRKALKEIFPDLYIYKVTTKQAITDEVLPDPRVFLIPLSLDALTVNQEIIKNKSQKITLEIPYSMRFQYAKVKNRRIVIKCTQRQYYDDMSTMIEWYKRKMYGSEVMKNLFLRKSGERLKWLSEQKTAYVKALLDLLRDQRTLTFCNGIPQTAELGKYCINSSKSKGENAENLGKFNSGRVKHITACNMLDEGMNLVNCRVGVYAVLNSSERMIKQKLGRLLRHSDPIIIIPYYVGTRDEELVNKMMEDYNPELVTKITSLTQLKL
jgi:superfamily II DNA or RNA helicase